MKFKNIWQNTPIRVGTYYILFFAGAMILCIYVVGVHEIAGHASKSKPYSAIFISKDNGGAFSARDLADDGQTHLEILMFGDSNMRNPPRGENNELAPLLEEAIRNKAESLGATVSKWQFPGANMFHYYCMLSWISNSPPDLVIIPINWRTFPRVRFDLEEYSHPELAGLVPFFQKLPPDQLDPLKYKDISPVEHLKYKFSLYSVYFIGIRGWAQSKTDHFLKRPLGVKDAGVKDSDILLFDFPGARKNNQRKSPTANGIISFVKTAFPMKIDNSNPTLLTLSSLSYLASERHVRVLFFIWPLNKELLARKGFLNERDLERSIELIGTFTDNEGVRLLDLSDLLENKYFFDFSGHCQVEGRAKVADALATEVVRILEKNSDSGSD